MLISADDVVRLLELSPHPEGGHFTEVFRSRVPVTRATDGALRSASTAIYFLLKTGEFSALHRVSSDEVWHHYLGDPLELHTLSEAGHRLHRLGPALAHGERPLLVVRAGSWQAARPLPGHHGFTLCGCMVAPGFEFADFEMPSREQLLALLPDHAELIHELTRLEP